MDSIDDYLKDPEYTNWVKSGLALNVTNEVLRPFVVKEITKLHQSIVKKLPPDVLCTGCSVNTRCPNGICDEIQREIKNKHCFPNPSFKNTCTGRWSTDPWEIAKCYMPPSEGYRRSSAADADFSACINVIINCKHFQAFGTSDPNITNVYFKSKKFRNSVMHSSSQKVSEQYMRDNLDTLINILNKIKTPETEDDTNEAIAKTQKIKTNRLKIKLEDVIAVLRTATEASIDKNEKNKDQVKRERLLVNFEAGCRKALCRLTEEHISIQEENLSVADFLSKVGIFADRKDLCSRHQNMLFPETGTHADIREWDLFVYCFILEELDLYEPMGNAVSLFVCEVKKIRNRLVLNASGVTQNELSELCEYLIDTDLNTEITEIFNKDSPDVDVISSFNILGSWWREEEDYGRKPVSKKQLNKTKPYVKEFEKINRRLAEYDKIFQGNPELEHVGENVTLHGANAAELDIDAECELRVRGCDEETEETLQEHITSPANNDIERNEAFDYFRQQRNLREVNPEEGSIILKVKCSSITNVLDFWDSCIDGRAVEALSKVRDYYRRYFKCDTLEFDVILTKKGFYRCVNKIIEVLPSRFDVPVDNVTYKAQEILKAKGAPTKMADAPIETDAQPLQPRTTSREEIRLPLHVPPIPDDFHFNELLLKIGKYITDDVLRKIKFKYGGELKTPIRAEIQSPEDLFTILRRRRYISPENVFHLQAIVMMIDDAGAEVELMEQIYEYSRRHNAVFFRKSTDEPPNGFRRIKFHVKGLEHYQFDTNAANTLKITVASLTGINTGDVLLDGIQLTNSIYVTLLIPGRHYILFYTLLKKGIPLLTELKIDMVTFEDGATINASDGSQIIEELPPIRESPDETIQRLKEVIDELESKDICYRKQIEELTLSDVSDDPLNDSSYGSSHHIESMNEAIEKLELEELELWQIDHQHDGMLETLKLEDDIYDSGVGSRHSSTGGITHFTDEEEYVRRVGSNDAPGNCRKESSVGDDRGLTDMKSTNTTDEGEDEVILSCDAQTRHFMEEAFQQQLNNLAERCRVLRAEITNKNATLKIALPVIDFKHGLMQQLETIFESKGETIPNEKGYKENVIKLAIDLSRAISHEEGKTLETGYQDVKITTEVKRDRRFLLLRLFYLENRTSDVITLIENFVIKKFSIIGREDLLKIWIDAVMPKSHRSRSRP